MRAAASAWTRRSSAGSRRSSSARAFFSATSSSVSGDAERAQRRDLEAVPAEQPVDLLDLRRRDVAAQREALEAAFHREQRRLGQARVGHARRQADVEAEVHRARDQHLAALHHQHVGSHGRLFRGDVGRQRHVEDHGARLALADVEHALAEGRGRGDDQVALADPARGGRVEVDVGARRLGEDLLLAARPAGRVRSRPAPRRGPPRPAGANTRSRSSPVAPTIIALPRARSGQPMRCAVSLAVSSVAAIVRLLPVVTGIGARRATVTPASPTTLVNAPRPTISRTLRRGVTHRLVQPRVGELRRAAQHLPWRRAERVDQAVDRLARRRASAHPSRDRPATPACAPPRLDRLRAAGAGSRQYRG